MNFKTEKININELTPAEYNPRIMKENEKNKLRNNLKTFGLVDPIIIDLTDNNTVIGGHQRLNILKSENPELELKLIRMGDIGLVFNETHFKIKDKNDQKALNLSLNSISGEFDFKKVEQLLTNLDQEHYNIELTGFDEEDILIDNTMLENDLELLEDEFNDNISNELNKEEERVEEDNKKSKAHKYLYTVDSILIESEEYFTDKYIVLCIEKNDLVYIKGLIKNENINLRLIKSQ